MQLKKGTSIIDASGNRYTLIGLDVRNQIVKNTVSLPGHDPVPGEMPVSQWKELANTPNTLEDSGIVDKATKPVNSENTDLAVAPSKTKLIIGKDMLFQMMDKSLWKIRELNRNTKKLVAVNEKTKKPQGFTLDELTTLANDGHIKILS